jgi:hypothetical protein
MSRSKRASHTRRSTPVRLASRIYAHTPPSRNGPCHQRHNLKQKYSPKPCGYEDDSEDTYISFLRGVRDKANDDDYDPGSDATDLEASGDGEELDEETTLVEMLGSSYSDPSLPYSPELLLIRGLTEHTEKRTSFRRSGARLRTLHTAYVRMLS